MSDDWSLLFQRASDRSWKPMWAVLRGHALYLFKDKASASVNVSVSTKLSTFIDASLKTANRGMTQTVIIWVKNPI